MAPYATPTDVWLIEMLALLPWTTVPGCGGNAVGPLMVFSNACMTVNVISDELSRPSVTPKVRCHSVVAGASMLNRT